MALNNVIIALKTQTFPGNEVVIPASRVEEKNLKSLVAIEKLAIQTIKESPDSTLRVPLVNALDPLNWILPA